MISCVIFDMDGTLIDSETLCNQALLDVIPEITIPLHELVNMFGGRKLSWMFEQIECKFKVILPKNIEKIYRERVSELFETDLRAFPGVPEMLAILPIPCCIATSAPRAKVTHALEKTELSGFFDDRIFSSYEIGSWKPEPEIFLHAAHQMSVLPRNCLVIEDSEAGIQAAKSAKMRVIQFCDTAAEPMHEEFFNSYHDFPIFGHKV
ncbi:HAD family hydrolase [Maritalea sp.]|uniref:HAD family hydrolase n=1 Tax=Maritalea sp. TaxID=2003361 RepID=UPI003EF24C5F